MNRVVWADSVAVFAALMGASPPAAAQQQQQKQQKPNIILIVSDDFGYGESAPYRGGPGRGMPTPNVLLRDA